MVIPDVIDKLKILYTEATNARSVGEVEARREHTVRVVLAMISLTLIPCILIVSGGYLAGIFPAKPFWMVVGLAAAAIACWVLIHYDHWQRAGDLMVVSFFFLAAYGSYVNGLMSNVVLAYPIVILLAAMFNGGPRRWVVVIVCIVAHSVLGSLHDQKPINAMLVSMVVVTFSLTGIALLQWFSTRLLKVALMQARSVEEKLRGEILERTEAESRLKYMSSHDAMTGLYNRFFFEAELERLQNSRLYPISVVMADLDGLKRINDYNGHPAGDELLKRTARVLRDSFRTEDVVARIGGDEFAVLLPQMEAGSMQAILYRLRENIEKCNQVCFDLTIELSVGVCTAEKGSVLSQVIKKADDAMYEEKWGKKVDAWRGIELKSQDGED